MSKAPDVLELIILDLIDSRLEAGEKIFMYSSGNLRGKLMSAHYLEEVLPSNTYLDQRPLDQQMEPCIQFIFIPRSRAGTITDPATFNFTRKPDRFNMPTRLADQAIFFQRLQSGGGWSLCGSWGLSINTSFK